MKQKKGKGTSSKKSKGGFFKKIIWAFLFLVIAGMVLSGYELYRSIFVPNVTLVKNQSDYLYIPSNSTYEDVIKILRDNQILNDIESFEWLSSRLNYRDNIHAGKYKLKPGMNNKELLTLLKSGRQTPVKLVINNIRTKQDLVSKISKLVEADSASLLYLMNNEEYLKKYDMDSNNSLSFIMPNTYEVYWNAAPVKILDKLGKSYLKFWNENRRNKAKNLGLKPSEVIILASIVEKETTKNSEKSDIAGVYINRLKLGRKLEADPTLVFASGDFNIRRVLNVHREIDSPYNTYMYAGLPPGPIYMPSASSIEAVLNYEKHEYLYFCAKPDFSGFHQFSRTFEEHLDVARKFRRELGKRNIMN